MVDVTFALEAGLLAAGVFAVLALMPRPSGEPLQASNRVVSHPPVQGRPPLDGLTVAELQAMARDQGMTGISRLRKADLIEALQRSAVHG
jgi:hypothetical protein